jgi:hypothetical protein
VAAQIAKDRHLKGTPVVYLTATVSHREAGPGGRLTSGGSVFIPKPVSLENLIKCINENIRKREEPESPKPVEATEPSPPPA